jgi:acyl-CoA thioesterase
VADETILARLLRRVDRSPFWKLLGMELIGAEEGLVRVRLTLRPDLQNSRGVMHGGALGALVDSAGGLAVLTTGVDGSIPTVEYSLNFLAPVEGGTVTAEGRLLRRGRRIAVSEVTVTDEAGRLIAKGLVTNLVAE